MLRKIIILFFIDLCIKCQSHPYTHVLSRRSLHKRIEHLEASEPTTATTTVPTTAATPIPKRKPEIGAYPVSSLGALAAPELQWHAAIYEKTTTPYGQICGGTVVTREFVISAAHCFWSDDVGVLRPALFAVAAGKLLRPWDASSDQYAEQSDVKNIHIPARFRGGATNFQADIALVRLSSPLEYAPGVQPACVSFDPDLEKLVLEKDNAGTVTGFGLIAENGEPSPRLTFLELPYIDISDCFRKVDPSFVKYLTSDKICAGYWEAGKALCRGDSGGGLIYTTEIPDSWETAPFLLGIASTAQRDKNECNAFTPASFTNIIMHKNFLTQLVPGLEDECRYAYLGLNRESGGKGRNETEDHEKKRPLKSNTDSLLDVRNSTAAAAARTPAAPAPRPLGAPTSALQAPVLEWYAAVYNKSTKPYTQMCGASVVKQDVVISAAHCFWGGDSLLDASLFKVAAGKLLQPWDAFEDMYTRQESDVDSIIVPPSYRDEASRYQGDVAVVRLRTPLRYSAAVRPVCVSFDAQRDQAAFCNTCVFSITGWAAGIRRDEPPGRLRILDIQVTDKATCRSDIDPSFRKYLGKDKVCVGMMSTAVAFCKGDVGGGLIRYSTITNSSKTVPFLHGVASTMELNGQKCAVPLLAPASFTHLLYHKDFLEEHIPGLEDECRFVYLGEGRRGGVNDRVEGANDESQQNVKESAATLTAAQNGSSDLSTAPVLEWYAAVYNKSTKPYTQICGASVVKQDVVISAAHCFWGGDSLLDASLFKVAAGKLLQPWDAFEDIDTRQESDVDSIIVPPRYRDEASRYQGDVAVVRLRTPLRYSAAVRPVCVSFDAQRDQTAFCNTCSFSITGWAVGILRDEPPGRLRYLDIPVTNRAKCRSYIDPSFRKYFGKDKVCVGFMSTALALCIGDVGGGLVRYSTITNSSKTVPFLHGVASTMEQDGQKCAVPMLAPASFTHLLFYKDFLVEHIPGLEAECRFVYLGEGRRGGVNDRVEGANAESQQNGKESAATLTVAQNGSSDLSTVSTPIQSTPQPSASPGLQASPALSPSPENHGNVFITVHNGTTRITVTAVNSVTLELYKL